MNSIKVVTICGSMKFQKEMVQIAEKLELEKNYAVLQCIFGDHCKHYTEKELQKLEELRFKKIEISDAIYVVNVNGYIGDATRKEIEYAQSLQKEILSLEPLCKMIKK